MPETPKTSKTCELCVLDIDYTVDEDGPVIRIFGRDDNDRSYIILDKSFMPYLYLIPKKDTPTDRLKDKLERSRLLDENNNIINIRSIEIVEKNIGVDKRSVLKIYTMIPSDVPKLKDILKSLPETEGLREFDIPFYKRYLFTNPLNPMGYINVTGTQIDDNPYSSDILMTAQKITPIPNKKKRFNILALDIETHSTSPTNHSIISISFYSTAGFRKVFSYKKSDYRYQTLVKDEKDLIKKIVHTLNTEKYDFIATYNGDRFDFPIIKQTADKYKIPLDITLTNTNLIFKRSGASDMAVIRGRPHLDIFKLVTGLLRTSLKSNRYSLDIISQEVLGERKHGLTYKDITDFWEEGSKDKLEKLFRYNLRDSELTERLASYFIPNLTAFCSLTHLPPSDTCRATYGNIVESFLIKRAGELDHIIPNRPSTTEISARRELGGVKGAFVVEPTPGLHKNIAVFDFKSLYPTIIIAHNISDSTLNCDCCKNIKATKENEESKENKVPGKPYYFCTKKKALVPTILEEILDKRSIVKKKLKTMKKDSEEFLTLYAIQFGLKTVANAFYGYLGFSGSRIYRRECAESVTAFGRNYIHKTIATAEKHNLEPIYGDTDSIFLKLKSGNIKETIHSFLETINKTLPGVMELEFEGIYSAGLFVPKKGSTEGAKKRYALLEDDGSMIIKGFENVRRDWSPLAKDTQVKVLSFVLNEKISEATEYTKKIIKRLSSGKVPLDELVIYTRITKPLNKYSNKGPHVMAAMKAKERGQDIEPGQTIGYIITSKGDSISDRAEIFEFAKDYDPQYYLNNQLLPSVLRILELFGVTKDKLLTNSAQTGLSAFTSSK